MKEQITIRLFKNDNIPTVDVTGRYLPDPIAGWDVATGETIPLSDQGGGRVFGIVDKVDPETREDDQGNPYRHATVWIQD